MKTTLFNIMNNLCYSLVGITCLTGFTQTAYADNATLPYWKDIQTVSVNREAPRSAFMTYADKAQAATGDYEKS